MHFQFSFPSHMPLPAPSKNSIHCHDITYGIVSDYETPSTTKAYNKIIIMRLSVDHVCM